MGNSLKKSIALLALFLVIGAAIYHFAAIDQKSLAGRAILNAGGILAPTISPSSQSFSGSLEITITNNSPGSTIRYTTDGSTPTFTHGTIYAAPFTITATTTLEVVASSGGLSSVVTVETYNLVSSPSSPGGKGGFFTPNPRDIPGYVCPADDPSCKSPSAPADGKAGQAPGAPAYGNVLSSGESFFSRNLAVGSRGNDVYSLQQFLYSGGFLRIAPTGYFGSATKDAVSAFQKSRGINPSGFVGPITIKKINLMLGILPGN